MKNFAPDALRLQTSDFQSAGPTSSGPEQITHCFIQAGGRSTRMGQDKAWIDFAGRPLIEHTLAAASQVARHITLIIDAANPLAERYQSLAKSWGATVSHDLFHHRGPLGGIYTALTLSQGPALILACDLPFVTAAFLQLLWRQHQDSGAALTIPLDRQCRVQMLAGVYSAACRAHIARMLSWDELMADRLRLRVSTRMITFGEYAQQAGAERMLVNINSAEDFQGLAQLSQTAGE